MGVSVLEALDAEAVRQWSRHAADALDVERDELNRINVFPVADADTGTNMAATQRAAADAAMRDTSDRAGTVLTVMARAAVLAARGNSGAILAQLLRGLADGAQDVEVCDAVDLRRALDEGAALAYQAVGAPVEGTMLSVARSAADAAKAAPGALVDVAEAAADGARQALLRSPEQLPVLARAGVVDAGGQGLLAVLLALVSTINGSNPAARAPVRMPSPPASAARRSTYEVQYLLDAPTTAIDLLRVRLAALGDSITVAGTGDLTDPPTWNIHVHTNDVAAAFEAGVDAGRPHRISVTRFDDQPGASTTTGEVCLIAVDQGADLAHLFESEGVVVCAPDAVLARLRAGTAQRSVLLVGPGSGVEPAVRALRADGVEVAVIPTRSPVQALAAVAVHDPGRVQADDTVAMAEAAAATRWAEVSVADGPAWTLAGPCVAGDVLGLIDDDVVEIGSDLSAVARAVLDRLLGVGGDLITLVIGRDADEQIGEALRHRVEVRSPGTEVAILAGGQRDRPLLIGLE